MTDFTTNDMGNKQIMADNIQYYINKSGKTRKQVAGDLGFPYTTFLDWVNGKRYPKIQNIEKMANYFGINKSDLVEDKNIDSEEETIHTIAAHAMHKLSEEEAQKVLEFAQFLISKHND